jgi:hypothetical protein
MTSAARERLDELLLTRATEGLGATEAQELARLLAAERNVDETAYERAAAAICLAVLGGRREVPPALRARLELSARDLSANPRER